MKNIKIVFLILLLCFLSFPFTSGCNNEKVDANCNIYWSNYQDITELTSEDAVETYSGETSNDSVQNGIIISPYYSLKINGQQIPVYATRSANGIHSFVYIDVEVINPNKEFVLQTEVTTLEYSSVLSNGGRNGPSVIVLPQKHGVTATINEQTISAQIKNTGSFSFVFNKSHEEPLTIFVAQKENTQEIFGDKEIVYIEPGDHATLENYQSTLFTESNKVYYFKEGRHKTDMITLPSDSVLYLERNAYVEVVPSPTGARTNFIKSSGTNVTVAGRGLLDISPCTAYNASSSYNKAGINFTNAQNVSFSGLTIINSQTWTLMFNDCKDIHVHDNFFIAYRVIADGIMLSDCKDAVVEYNFVRTGDDAFETKSTTKTGLTERVLFQHNDAWTDKAIAYGCVYESNQDTRGVRFENNTVGFALGNWSGHLGCCTIQMGNNPEATMEDIVFENIEIYATNNPAALNLYIGGNAGQGEGWGTINNITFKNITIERNSGAVLGVRTYSSDGCFIGHVYISNVYSNGELFTQTNYFKDGRFLNRASNFDPDTYLHINND